MRSAPYAAAEALYMTLWGAVGAERIYPVRASEGSAVSAARRTPGTPPWRERIDKQRFVECTNRIDPKNSCRPLQPAHIGTYGLHGPKGSIGVVELFEEGDLQARGGFQPRVE